MTTAKNNLNVLLGTSTFPGQEVSGNTSGGLVMRAELLPEVFRTPVSGDLFLGTSSCAIGLS